MFAFLTKMTLIEQVVFISILSFGSLSDIPVNKNDDLTLIYEKCTFSRPNQFCMGFDIVKSINDTDAAGSLSTEKSEPQSGSCIRTRYGCDVFVRALKADSEKRIHWIFVTKKRVAGQLSQHSVMKFSLFAEDDIRQNGSFLALELKFISENGSFRVCIEPHGLAEFPSPTCLPEGGADHYMVNSSILVNEVAAINGSAGSIGYSWAEIETKYELQFPDKESPQYVRPLVGCELIASLEWCYLHNDGDSDCFTYSTVPINLFSNKLAKNCKTWTSFATPATSASTNKPGAKAIVLIAVILSVTVIVIGGAGAAYFVWKKRTTKADTSRSLKTIEDFTWQASTTVSRAESVALPTKKVIDQPSVKSTLKKSKIR